MKKRALFLTIFTVSVLLADASFPKKVFVVPEASSSGEEMVAEGEGVHFLGVMPPKDDPSTAQELSLSRFPFHADGMQKLSSALADLYRRHDGVKVGVRVAKTLPEEGFVQLVVTPEKLGKIRVAKATYNEPKNLAKWIRLSENGPIDEKLLAKDVAWLNSHPYRSVKTAFQPGEKPGVSDLDLIVEDKKNWKISSGADNTGTQPIGEARFFGKVDVNHFLFPDHTLQIQTTSAKRLKAYQSYFAQYEALLPWRNTLKIFGSYSQSDPKGSPYPRKLKKSYQASLRYGIPYWTEEGSLIDLIKFETGFDFKGTNTNLQFEDDPTPVNPNLAYVGQFLGSLFLEKKGKSNNLSMGADFIGSPARMLSHQSDADFSNLREGATPRYFYTRLALTMTQDLPSGWSLFAKGRGQFSPSELIPSEQFSLGGYSTVRGYEERSAGGDNAICGNFELRFPKTMLIGSLVSKFEDSLQLLCFADGGYAWFNDKLDDAPKGQSLLGVGAGARYEVASYLNARLDIGTPLWKIEKSPDEPRIHLSAIFSY